MKTILLVLLTVFITLDYNAQNTISSKLEQTTKSISIAQIKGKEIIAGSFVSNYFRNKIILLVLGGIAVAIGGAIVNSNKKQD